MQHEQSGFSGGKPIVPPTEENTQETKPIEVLSEQISQTQQALAQLIELNKAQMQTQVPVEPEIEAPAELKADDLLNPDTETGKYFLNVMQEREKKIVDSVTAEYNKKLRQIETERMVESRLNSLAEKNKLSDERLSNFRSWMTDPKNVDMGVLYDVYNKINPVKQKPAGGRMTQVASAGGAGKENGFLGGLKK